MNLRAQWSLMCSVIDACEDDILRLEMLREAVVNLNGVISDAIGELSDKQRRAASEAYEIQTMLRAAKAKL